MEIKVGDDKKLFEKYDLDAARHYIVTKKFRAFNEDRGRWETLVPSDEGLIPMFIFNDTEMTFRWDATNEDFQFNPKRFKTHTKLMDREGV